VCRVCKNTQVARFLMPSVSQIRMRRRYLRHHLPLLLLSVASVAALYFTRPYADVISWASFATAYPAMILLGVTLLIGPWNLLRKQRNPISGDFRRDVGIWAGILSVVHTAVGQCVHLRGRPWLYYIYSPQEHQPFPIRHDLFGLANYTGAAAILVVAVLLATSNDLSLRKMGTPQWKQLQRWNYAAFAFTAIHAVSYLVTEKQKLPFDVTIAVCIGLTLVFQVTGYWLRRAALSTR